MNLVLLSAAEVADGATGIASSTTSQAAGRAVLGGKRARHVAEVIRARTGDTLRVGIAGGARGHGSVVEVTSDRVVLDITLEQPPSPRPRVSLVLAVPRPKVIGRALEAAAASGVARIDLVNAWRVERSYLASPRLAPEVLADHLWLGCEQGATTFVPEVALHPLLMPFLDAASPWPAGALRLIAHPRAELAIERAATPGQQRAVVLAIGPEGGFIDRELSSFGERGFVPVSLGAAVLRSEHAVVAALAQLGLLARLS